MKQVLFTNHYKGAPLSLIRSIVPAGLQPIFLDKPGREEIIRKAKDADYILAGGREKIDAEVLEAAPKLKMIHRSGVGLDSLDLQAIAAKNIHLFVNSGINAQSVAEHSMLLILGVLRNIAEINNRTKDGDWVKHEIGIHCHNLRGKKVGFIGFGKIAIQLAAMLAGFGVNLYYNKPNRLDETAETKFGVKWLSLDELFATSDILTLQCALNHETAEIINRKSLRHIKKGAVIINTARGGLIDEVALVEALNEGHISGVGLDVFAKEPIAVDHPFLTMKNVLITPHIGSITEETFTEMIGSALTNILYYEQGDHSKITANKLL